MSRRSGGGHVLPAGRTYRRCDPATQAYRKLTRERPASISVKKARGQRGSAGSESGPTRGASGMRMRYQLKNGGELTPHDPATPRPRDPAIRKLPAIGHAWRGRYRRNRRDKPEMTRAQVCPRENWTILVISRRPSMIRQALRQKSSFAASITFTENANRSSATDASTFPAMRNHSSWSLSRSACATNSPSSS